MGHSIDDILFLVSVVDDLFFRYSDPCVEPAA